MSSRRRRWTTALCIVGAMGTSACASIWGFQDSVDGGDGGADGSGADTTMPPADAGKDVLTDHAVDGVADTSSDTGNTMDSSVTDAEDAADTTTLDTGSDAADTAVVDASDGGSTDPCTTATPAPSAFYVATTGNDVATCGGQGLPCQTIQFGLTHASVMNNAIVYVAEGTYAEAITLPQTGVSVIGGWTYSGGVWAKDPSPNAKLSLVLQPAAGSTTVTVLPGSGNDTVCEMSIQSKNAALPGETLYGVFARGAATTLLLQDVSITVAAGGAGLLGAPGSAGTGGLGGCTPAGTGVTGAAGTPGQPGPMSSFGAFGYVPGNGSVGLGGGPGTTGMAGGPGMCVNCVSCTPCILCCTTNVVGMSCGLAGEGGCSGQGGTGGTGGEAGGSSVAVFASQSAVVTSNGSSTLATGNGGNGAAGGSGGPGGTGANGAMGPPAMSNCAATVCDGSCNATTPGGGMGGSPGTKGGNGGVGGAGGGGSGGYSCSIVKVSPATVTPVGAVLMHGNPGTGAAGAATGTGAQVCDF
jgi:hypothetical protein